MFTEAGLGGHSQGAGGQLLLLATLPRAGAGPCAEHLSGVSGFWPQFKEHKHEQLLLSWDFCITFQQALSPAKVAILIGALLLG